MRSNEELMSGILERKSLRLAQRQARALAAAGAGLAALLAAALLVAPGITGQVEQPAGSALGATILGPEAGGYVIVALLAFGLGIVAALFAGKTRGIRQAEAGVKKQNEQNTKRGAANEA